MITCCDTTRNQVNKIIVYTELYKELNRTFPLIIQYHSTDKWRKFAHTMYNKILEFETEFLSGVITVTDKELVKSWLTELNKAKRMVMPYIFQGLYRITTHSK